MEEILDAASRNAENPHANVAERVPASLNVLGLPSQAHEAGLEALEVAPVAPEFARQVYAQRGGPSAAACLERGRGQA